jgi:nitroreductase
MNSIFHRTSVRHYMMSQKVEKEKIELMLRAAMAAPSAGNQQPWEYYVVTDRHKLGELAMCSPYAASTGRAPLAFVACYRKMTQLSEYAEIDMSASVENLLLEADTLGLGAVWMGIAPVRDRMERVKTVLGIPDMIEAFAIIACGYPQDETKQQDRYEENRVHYVE